MTTDPKAAFDFYAELFGWTRGQKMPMGDAGDYQLVQWQGTDIGGVMALGKAPKPVWLPYFGVDQAVAQAIETIKSSGGHIEAGPMEVPGPAYTALGHDPQGAWFAVVGGTR